MHTQTHSSLSYTHKTKRLLAQDCGTGEVWAPSTSRPRVLKAWLISRGRSRHWPALICEVRWELGHTSSWNSWIDSFPVPLLMQMINTSRLWNQKCWADAPFQNKRFSPAVCATSVIRAEWVQETLPWPSRGGRRRGFVAPSLALYHNLYPTFKPRLLHRLFNLFLFCAYNKAVTATRISQAGDPRVVSQP